MIGATDSPHVPTDAQRLATRARPRGPAVMYQQWRDLLFLHWEFPVATLQATLPPGLFVDTFEGKAHLGIVPFFMRRIRPRFLPAMRGLSDFMELNLRTYVHDRSGIPGVWFYSLDANQWLAVEIARRLFHLPYEHARMDWAQGGDGAIRYRSERSPSPPDSGVVSEFSYASGAPLPLPRPGSLEFFLIERYRLYAHAPGGLRRGAVFHEPYSVCQPELNAWNDELFSLNGFPRPERPPDHVLMSPGVDVTIFPLEQVERNGRRLR